MYIYIYICIYITGTGVCRMSKVCCILLHGTVCIFSHPAHTHTFGDTPSCCCYD